MSSSLGKPCLGLEDRAELFCIFQNPKASSTPHFPAIFSTNLAKNDLAGALPRSRSSEPPHLFHLLLEMVLALSPVQTAKCLGGGKQRLDVTLSGW